VPGFVLRPGEAISGFGRADGTGKRSGTESKYGGFDGFSAVHGWWLVVGKIVIWSYSSVVA
jgi:hypothetical protein